MEPTANSAGSITYGHIYTDDSSHTVTLTITDDGGLSTTVMEVYAAQTTPTVVLATPSPSTYGQSISFTATVSSATAGVVPGGSVQFLINGVNFGQAVACRMASRRAEQLQPWGREAM